MWVASPTHQRSSTVRLHTPTQGPDSHPPHPFYITSYWGAFVSPRFYSFQYVMCGCYFQIIFVSIVGDCLDSKSRFNTLQCISEDLFQFLCIYFAKQYKYLFYKVTGQQPEFLTLPVAQILYWTEETHRTLWRYHKRKWSPSIKLHKSIAKLIY